MRRHLAAQPVRLLHQRAVQRLESGDPDQPAQHICNPVQLLSHQNNGRILSALDCPISETVNYGYDSLNRLSSAAGTGWGESYTYDGFGNLTDKNVTSGSAPPPHVTVNAATNRLQRGRLTYTYDS